MLAALLAGLAACSSEDGENRLVVVSNGEIVGHLVSRQQASSVDIDYYVDNNGRGPKIKETIDIDSRGYPLTWTINGSSLFGADVSESYSWDDGVARWSAQADSGRVDSATPAMYIAGDGSPWSLGMYARAALDSKDGSLDVLPSGRLTLTEVTELSVGDNQPVSIYAINGIGLSPQLVALDDRHRLFAEFGSRGAIIREGYDGEVTRFQDIARQYQLDSLREMQQALAHNYTMPVRVDNVHVFDVAAGVTGEPVSVTISDGLISDIAVAGDADDGGTAVVIDGEGGTIVPGLYDMHSHSSHRSGLFYLAAGVTSTRDLGNDNTMLPGLIEDIDAGRLAGPRITPAGLIEARSPYSARIGIVADTLEEALEAVHWYHDHGYDEIKSYNSMNAEWVEPLVSEAKSLGMRVTGHVPAFMTADAVVVAGFDAVAHINQLMLGWLLEPGEDTRTALRLTGMKRAADLDLDSAAVQRSIALMLEHDAALDTTAVILERLMLSRAAQVQPGDAPYLDHMPIGYQRYRKRTFVPLDDPADDERYRVAFDKLLDVIKLLHDRGVRLLIGTDDATGFTVHRELELYVEAGLTPAESLRIATFGAAEYLGQTNRLGAIAPGMAADFFLVPGDPTKDISVIRQMRLVASRGTIYYPEEIYAALGIRPFGRKPDVTEPGPATQ